MPRRTLRRKRRYDNNASVVLYNVNVDTIDNVVSYNVETIVSYDCVALPTATTPQASVALWNASYAYNIIL